MIANNKINTFRFGIVDLFNCFDATIERDHEGETMPGCKIDSLVRYSVSLVIAIRNVKINLISEFPQKLVNKGDSSCSIHIIIPVNKYLLPIVYCLLNPVDGFVHVL